jgi:hypothetical protein
MAGMLRVRVLLLITVALAFSACGGAVSSSTPTSPPSQSAAFTDMPGDVRDGGGQPVDGSPHVDVTSTNASISNAELSVEIQVADAPPQISTSQQEVNYAVLIDVVGDEGSDYWLFAGNRSDAQYHLALDDFVDGYTYDDEEYPGTGDVAGSVVRWSVPLSALGDPSPDRVRLQFWVQVVDPPTGDVLAEDRLPDDSGEWLSLE